MRPAPENSPRPTSLEPSETNPPSSDDGHINHSQGGNPEFHLRSATREESTFRHSGWAERRRQVYTALSRTHQSSQRLAAFANCGAGCWCQRTTEGNELRIVSDKCHDRFCLRCGTERAAIITEAVAAAMSEKTCRFITLTLRHSETSLADQIDRLYRSFSTLRRRKFWMSCVSGGAAFLEVKLSKVGQWHPHLHIIATGNFVDQKELSREWHAVTGDSSIVDVRAIPSHEDRARYVTKYVTKPAPTEVFSQPEKLDEMVCSMRGRRLCLTFGSWRGIQLDGDAVDERKWVSCGSVEQIIDRAIAGDAEGIRYVEALLRNYPYLQRWIDRRVDSATGPDPI